MATKLKKLSRKRAISSSDDVMRTNMDRCLNVYDVIFLGFGHTVGAGLYVVTGMIAKRIAGPSVVLSYLVAGIAAMFSGLCYSELGTRVPRAGSAYAYCVATIGEIFAFFVGWNMILENVIGAASVARSLSGYTDSFCDKCFRNATIEIIGHIHQPLISSYIDILAGLLVILIMPLLLVSVKKTSIMNQIFSAINVVTIIIVIFGGLAFVDFKLWTNPKTGGFLPFGWAGMFQAAGNAFYGFVGFENISSAAEETRHPSKTLPKALISVLFIAAFTYMAIGAVLTLMVPYAEIDKTYSIAHAFEVHGCSWIRYLVTTGAMSAMIATIACSIYGASRLTYSMAQDGLLFSIFEKLTTSSKIPIYGVIFNSIFSIIISVFFDLEILVELLSIGTLTAYTMVSVCLLVLRYNDQVNCQNEAVPLNEIDGDEHICEDLMQDVMKPQWSWVVSKFPFMAKKNTIINLSILAIMVDGVFIIFLSRSIGSVSAAWILGVLLFLCFIVLVVLLFIISVYKQEAASNNAFKVPCVPLVPVISLLINLGLICSLQSMTWLRQLVWLLVGLVLYFAYGIRHSKLS